MLNMVCGFGLTPLHVAIEKDQVEIVHLILEKRIDINKESFVDRWQKVTPLRLAFQLKNFNIIDLLFAYNPTDGLTGSKEELLELMTWTNNPLIAQFLLGKLKNMHGRLTIHIALQYNLNGMMEHFIIVDHPCAIHDIGELGLQFAAFKCKHRIAKLMLKYDLTNNAILSGSTPLHIAAQCGYQTLTQVLVENGADIDIQSVTNSTPLMMAIQSNRQSTAKVLIEHGASLKKRNIDNLSPLEIALIHKKLDVALMIQYLSSD